MPGADDRMMSVEERRNELNAIPNEHLQKMLQNRVPSIEYRVKDDADLQGDVSSIHLSRNKAIDKILRFEGYRIRRD